MRFPGILLVLASTATALAGQRINQEGRVLGPAPVVTQPILFDTAQADAIVSAMQIMPVTSAWNEDVSRLPVLSNSTAMIAQITSDLSSSHRTLQAFYEMNYVLVPDNQATLSINFFNYPDESDLNGGVSPNALYPIPTNLPIETWPVGTGSLTLQQWQQNVTNDDGDRHAIMVQPGAGFIYETWETQLTSTGWQASNGAIFNLNSNALRPAGWTSGDAGGLAMFPALVRYDECERGMVEHAVRLVVKQTQANFIYPANHHTGSNTNVNEPSMGQRIRLKASFVIPSTWTIEEKAVALALKKYGGIVADNGNFFSFSVCPDDRFSANAFADITSVAISNFEVVQSTVATGGPRSAGAPSASGGGDKVIPFGTMASLAGAITNNGGPAPTILWKLYSGPGTVTFGNSASAATTATFTHPGTYILELSAADGVHAVAYDAVTINVLLPVTASVNGQNFVVQFPTVSGQTYRVVGSPSLSANSWTIVADNIVGTGATRQVTVTGALSQKQQFYGVVVVP